MNFEQTTELSVLIPVYNEVGNIESLCLELVDELRALEISYELIFINDGSKDGTDRILRLMEERYFRIRVLELNRHFGKSTALRQGFLSCRGPLVMTIDGDRQNDPRDIPRFLEAADSWDAVIGWRHQRKDTLWKRIQSRAANALRRLYLKDHFHDIHCPFRIFRKAHILRMPDFEGVHRFYPVLLEAQGYSVGEIKINDRPRYRGKSKYRMRNRARQSVADMRKVKRRISHQNQEETR